MYRYIRNDIYFGDDNNLKIDWERDDHNGITLDKGKNKKGDPYIAESTDLGGHKVYSVYPYHGDEHVKIYKALKQGNIGIQDYRDWLYDIAVYIYYHIIKQNKTDVIAVPYSSSSLVEDIAKEICKVSKGSIDYLPNAFRKNPVSKIILDIPESIAETNPSFVKKAEAALDKLKREGGQFEAKRVYKPALKFYRNIYSGDMRYADELKGQVVAVLDDSMSSRSTMINMFDVCDNVYQVADCYGVTAFKHITKRA